MIPQQISLLAYTAQFKQNGVSKYIYFMALLYLETCLNIVFTRLIQILLTRSSSSLSHGCCHCFVTLDNWSLVKASCQVGFPNSISVLLFLVGWWKSFKIVCDFVVPSQFVLVYLRLALQLFFSLSCAN